MVVLSKKLKDLPPEERLKKLKQIEEERKKELETKKKELEDLQKKAEEEEEQHKKEIEEAEKLIRESIEDLQEEEEKLFKELERARRQQQEEQEEGPSLEDMVEKEQARPEPKSDIYGKILEEMKQGAGFYEVTDYNVMNAVDHLAQKSAYENLSFQEQESLRNLKKNLERVQENPYYAQKDSSNSNYLEKLNQTISQIEQNMLRRLDYEKKKDDKRKDDSLYQTNQTQQAQK